MPTSEELLTKMNECIETLQDAQETVVNAQEKIANAPVVAAEAKALAEQVSTKLESPTGPAGAAQTAANNAQATANTANATANECAGLILRKTEKGDDIAAAHNCIYRGKNLTSVYTLDQLSAKVQAGDFSDLYIGDYITKPFTYNGNTVNVNWRFGHFNYWKYMGDTSLTANHILMLPDTSLFSSKMQETNTTAGGVPASIVWGLLQNAVHAAINGANCMNGHVLQHRDWIPDSVNANAASAAGAAFAGSTVYTATMWRDVKLGMFKEPMVYGCHPFGSSGYDVGCGKSQIALFRLDPTWINGRAARCGWWLGAVASSANFCYAYGGGLAIYAAASASYGVRPYFLFS